jgi:hypothetical protein
MDEELLPLSEAKIHLHELVKHAERRDLILLRHGRPVGVLLGYRRYRGLLEDVRRGVAGSRDASIATALSARRAEVERICRRHSVRRLSMFGSAARGEDEQASDVDILVEFAPMRPAERAEAYFGLHADLERLLGRAVDLLEESAIRNPYLEESIARDATVLYDAA